MSFCGKKYKRVSYENVEELVKASKSRYRPVAKMRRKHTDDIILFSETDRGCKLIRDTLNSLDDVSDAVIKILQQGPPIFSFTRIDEDTFQLNIEGDGRQFTHRFKLGEEHDMTRRDGSKVRVTYNLEGDNVLKQVIKQPDGKIAYFRREFGETETKMIVTMEGTDVEARIYYEAVE